jgi:MFS transporter, DHA1 family, multidrug resistance protein
MLIFVGFLNYLVDAYLMYAASAIAANTVARSACGAAAPLFTTYMFDALGIGGGGSLIGGVATLLAVIPFAFYKYGESIRRRSKFAPTKDSNNDAAEDRPHQDSDGSSTRPSSDQSSPDTAVAHEPYEGEKQREDVDDVQNTLGEPREENTGFGKMAE